MNIDLDGDSSEEDEEMVIEIPLHLHQPQSVVIQESETMTLASTGNANEKLDILPVAMDSLKSLFKKEEEEEEDEDEPIALISSLASTSSTEKMPADEPAGPKVASQDFLDALHAVNTDPWDVMSWRIYIEEAENLRGGSVVIDDVYSKVLLQFPRAFKFWKSFAEYYVQKGDFISAEGVYKKCLTKCRSVTLWLSYLDMMKKKTIGRVKPSDQQYSSERQLYESAFKSAVENVGSSSDSGKLWRAYLDFVKEWSELGSIDPGRKLLTLRQIYQKAISIPMEALDVLWKEYEALEKAAGEHYADKLLPEYHEKFLHARAIYRERKEYTGKISFERLAVPPRQSVEELRQLEAWNRWIRFELTNPDNLTSEAFQAFMSMLFDQCLCCFRLHPEVWMTIAHYEYGTYPHRLPEARAVLREAIETIPDVVLLRVALAELEECHGGANGVDAAREVLRTAFEAQPSVQSFSVYQRFVRRKDGVTAARKLFSETLPLRKEGKLGYELHLVHAQLELDTNCSPQTALKVLQLARETDPQATAADMRFTRLLTRVLLRLGDLNQIRWFYQTLLGDEAASLALSEVDAGATVSGGSDSLLAGATTNVIVSGLTETSSYGRGHNITEMMGSSGGSSSSSSGGTVNRTRPLRDQLQLWDDYLLAETMLGCSDISRLDQLRVHRNRVRSLLEAERGRTDRTSAVAAAAAERLNAQIGLFDRSAELSERYEILSSAGPDEDLRQRSRGKAFLREVARLEEARVDASKETSSRQARSRWGGHGSDQHSAVSELAEAQLASLLPLVREFLGKLPALAVGAAPPDVDGVVKQLRGMVLPPRPTADESEAAGTLGGGLKRGRDGDGGERGVVGPESLVALGADEEDDDGYADSYAGRDDVFRRRQRERFF